MNKQKCMSCGVTIFISVAFFLSALIVFLSNAQ